METGKDVWVIIEHSDGEIKPVSFEMINAAKTLASKTGGKVAAAWLYSGGSGVAEQLADHGADLINVFQHVDLAKYSCAAGRLGRGGRRGRGGRKGRTASPASLTRYPLL